MADTNTKGSIDLDDGTQIAASVWFGHAITNAGQHDADEASDQPDLIILCSWMGAATKHINKYVQTYRKAYPSSAILVIASSIRDTISSAKAQESRLLIACNAILGYCKIGSKKDEAEPSVLLHCMSNGGGIAGVRLTMLLRERFQLRNRLYRRVILDCTPGTDHVESAVRALSMNAPGGFIGRTLVRCMLRVVLYTIKFLQNYVLCREPLVARLRRQLNDTTLFTRDVPRLYLYSKADQLIHHGAVSDHARLARMAGYLRVEEEVFDRAAHCALAIDDGPRYWNGIQNFWSMPSCPR